MDERPKESWGLADAYESYVGRWSRRVASAFIDWLGSGPGLQWGDVGCGTGALVASILAQKDPASIVAIDRAEGFVRAARELVRDPRVQIETGDALALAWPSQSLDVTVSGLVLNFVPDARAMAAEMVRVTRPEGTVGAYVWDYEGGMQMIRHFWDAAVLVDPQAAQLDQGERFPICKPQALETLFGEAGLHDVSVRAIEVATDFRDFDDYWIPFTLKTGSAPTYLASLEPALRDRIREAVRARLPAAADGSIGLTAKAWAVKGKTPG